MHIIPSFIRQRISHRPNLVKIFDNMGWLLIDKVLRMGAGLLVGVWVARYLGPKQFGLFNYSLAFVGIFGAIAGLGLQSIVVRDTVRDPSSKAETIGTAASLLFISGALAYGCCLGAIFWLRPDEILAKALVAILGSVMLFKASEVAIYWFESQVTSKYTVWVQNGIFLIFSCIKVILIMNKAPLLVFAWATMLEALMVASLMIIMLGLKGIKLLDLKVSLAKAKSLLTDSWPLLFSGIAIMIYMRIDQVMLGQMADDQEVGIYSAASRISEVWYFMIGIVLTSVFPTLASQHAENNEFLSRRWVQLYRVMFWMSISSALIVTFGSSFLVGLLYGNAYQEAQPVLCILVWAGVNVAIGSVWSNWLLLENKLQIGLYGHLVGAGLNIILNILLIPDFGAKGSAYATLLSYWISALFVYSLHKARQTYSLIFEAIFFWKIK